MRAKPLISKILFFFDHLITPSCVGVRTNNLLCVYSPQRWKRTLKSNRVFFASNEPAVLKKPHLYLRSHEKYQRRYLAPAFFVAKHWRKVYHLFRGLMFLPQERLFSRTVSQATKNLFIQRNMQNIVHRIFLLRVIFGNDFVVSLICMSEQLLL